MSEKTLTRNLLVKEKPTPVEKQIEFLKKVIFDQEEYEKLLEDVEGYCAKQKPPINLNMDVLQKINEIIMYNAAIEPDFEKECGKEGTKSIENMQKTVQRMKYWECGNVPRPWPHSIEEILKKLFPFPDPFPFPFPRPCPDPYLGYGILQPIIGQVERVQFRNEIMQDVITMYGMPK